MKYLILAAAIALALAGCASDPFDLSEKKAEETNALFAAGKITRLELYTRAFDDAQSLPSYTTKIADLRYFSAMIANEQQLTNGAITQTLRDERARAAKLQREIDTQEADKEFADRRLNAHVAISAIKQSQKPTQQPALPYLNKGTNCTSTVYGNQVNTNCQ